MKKKEIVFLVVFLIVVIGVIGFLLWNNRTLTTITLDINPSFEIKLNRHNKVKSIQAINKDAKNLLKKNYKGKSLDDTFENLFNQLFDQDYIYERDLLNIVLYSEGKISNKKIKEKIFKSLEERDIDINVIEITKITEEDEKLAKKYHINPAKVSYIRSIVKENQDIPIEFLVNKSINELHETKNTGFYCSDGYILEGSWCLKEKERKPSSNGKICPEGYSDYQGTCYLEGHIQDGTNYFCREDFQLDNNKCYRKRVYNAKGKCSKGQYDDATKKCIEKTYVGEAVEYCRITPGEDLLYNGRCLGRKPTIDGGCLGDDQVIDGWCYDTSPTSGYEADWMCMIDGEIHLIDKNGDGKCYKETLIDPISYSCDRKDQLVGTECVKEEIEDAQIERFCSNGYTLIDNSFCIDLNNTTSKVDGFVCEGERTRLKGDICIIYEMVEAKHS